MRGGARPGAGRKRRPDKPLTLAEIGRRIEALGAPRVEQRGRYLRVWLPSEHGPLPLTYTKMQALALLKRIESRAKT